MPNVRTKFGGIKWAVEKTLEFIGQGDLRDGIQTAAFITGKKEKIFYKYINENEPDIYIKMNDAAKLDAKCYQETGEMPIAESFIGTVRTLCPVPNTVKTVEQIALDVSIASGKLCNSVRVLNTQSPSPQQLSDIEKSAHTAIRCAQQCLGIVAEKRSTA